jgi:hypothetical protein
VSYPYKQNAELNQSSLSFNHFSAGFGMKETQRRRIMVTSSLTEISTDPASKKGGSEGGGVTPPALTHFFIFKNE